MGRTGRMVVPDRIWRRPDKRGDLHVHVSSEAVDMVHQLHHALGVRGVKIPPGDLVDASIRFSALIAHWRETDQFAEVREVLETEYWKCYGHLGGNCLDEEGGL